MRMIWFFVKRGLFWRVVRNIFMHRNMVFDMMTDGFHIMVTNHDRLMVSDLFEFDETVEGYDFWTDVMFDYERYADRKEAGRAFTKNDYDVSNEDSMDGLKVNLLEHTCRTIPLKCKVKKRADTNLPIDSNKTIL